MATGKHKRVQRDVERDAFAKTRIDHASETFEDYCEAVQDILLANGTCRVSELARFMKVSHVTVIRTVGRMVAAELAFKKRHGPIELSATGRKLARAARARHATVLDFLLSIGVPETHAKRDAEGIEHHAGSRTLSAMRRHLADHRGDERANHRANHRA